MPKNRNAQFSSTSQTVTVQQVATFDRLKSQLVQLYNEISALSKKSPDGTVNKFKLGLINEKLADTNDLIGEDSRPSRQFTIFDLDVLPTNSDVVIMLSQYLDALELWRSGRVRQDNPYKWCWNTDDGTRIDTSHPTRFTFG
jgi:hypothetical protein